MTSYPFVHFERDTGKIIWLSTSAFAPPRDGIEVAEIDGPPVSEVNSWKVDLSTWSHGTVKLIEVPPNEIPSISLSDTKAALVNQLNAAAEYERSKYLTPGAGQALVYEAKSAEVQRWRDAGSKAKVDGALYPWAADRAARLGVSVATVLAEWAAHADAWAAVAISIERIRESAKEAINAATDVDKAKAAAVVVWPAIETEKAYG